MARAGEGAGKGKAPRGDAPPARERSRRGTALRWLVYLIAALGWIYALFGSEGLFRQYERLQQRDALRAKLAAERAVNDGIRAEVEALRKDDLRIEQEIRRRLDYQRPGEIVLITGEDDPLAPENRRKPKPATPAAGGSVLASPAAASTAK
ncbi:MAG: septum formation initiator family protein [Acidobacteria bacterium]|jgi:cell division protein FtsB|nr:septum formation initiator family protein [Acidobacteriota bacterium]